MGKGSNSLTSHHGESRSHRADKMSGWISGYKNETKDRGWRQTFSKKFSVRKLRMFLKNPRNWNKI